MENVKIDNELILSGNDNAIEKIENVLREPSWSLRRKFVTFSIIIFTTLAFLFYKLYPILYPEPTCNDSIRNGLEEGIDCNGECKLVCKESSLPINVVKTAIINPSMFSSTLFKTGIIYLENPNRLSSPYEISVDYKVFDASNTEIISTTTIFKFGTQKQNIITVADLPAETKTISVTNLKYKMYKTFGSISVSLKNFEISSNGQSMRVTVSNVYDEDINTKIPLILVVKNSKDEILAVANQELDGLKYRESKELFFTWTTDQIKEPNSNLRVEIIPVSELFDK